MCKYASNLTDINKTERLHPYTSDYAMDFSDCRAPSCTAFMLPIGWMHVMRDVKSCKPVPAMFNLPPWLSGLAISELQCSESLAG